MILDLSSQGLTTLHEFDLSGVTTLYCYYNQLTSLPPLPETLKKLYCSNNQLTSLPPLPETLEILYCQYNQLTSLPPLPETLKKLICWNNQLTSLPPLPETLEILSCSNNQLTSIPPLPETLQQLYCEDNQLMSLPPLPWGLKNMEKEKLDQHSKKLVDLQMNVVETLPDKRTWDEIDEMWLHHQYKIGGEKYKDAVKKIDSHSTTFRSNRLGEYAASLRSLQSLDQ